MSRRLPVTDLATLSESNGSRPMMSTVNQDSTSPSVSTNELREYFECPVCYEVPRTPPIFACSQGHMLCGRCRPQLRSCPLCRISLENATRLFFAERLLEERIPLPCCNAELGCKIEHVADRIRKHETEECPFGLLRCENGENGCRQKVQRRSMREHLETCEWKPVECPVTSCTTRLPRTKVLIHLQTHHLSVIAGGRLDNRTKIFIIFFVLSLILNLIFFWQFSQSDI